MNVSAATISGLSQLGGWAYIDRNNDGNLAFATDPDPEYVIDDVVISLFSSVGNVETLVATTQTDQFGRYVFENITPGSYVLREAQPVEFVDGIDTLGVLESLNGQPISGSTSAGAAGNNEFANIVLTADVGGEFYNFGERGLAAGYVSKRYFFASLPPMTPPPPGNPPGGPLQAEPASLFYALMAACGCCFMLSRRRRS